MTVDPKLLAAETEARLARTRLFDTLAELQAKISPGNIVHRVADRVKETGEDLVETGIETAQKRPWAAAGLGAGLALLFLRKPVRRLVDRATGHAAPRSSSKSKGSNDD